MSLEPFRQQDPFGRRFRVKFITDPGFLDIESLLKPVDNALADVAEGSDIIGEYLYLYWHFRCLPLFSL
jgi:hypothetical protein